MLKVQLKKYVGAVQMLKREGQPAEGEGETEPGGGGGAGKPFYLHSPCTWHKVGTQLVMSVYSGRLEEQCWSGFWKTNYMENPVVYSC